MFLRLIPVLCMSFYPWCVAVAQQAQGPKIHTEPANMDFAWRAFLSAFTQLRNEPASQAELRWSSLIAQVRLDPADEGTFLRQMLFFRAEIGGTEHRLAENRSRGEDERSRRLDAERRQARIAATAAAKSRLAQQMTREGYAKLEEYIDREVRANSRMFRVEKQQ